MSLAEWLKTQPGRCEGCGAHIETQGCKCDGFDEWAIFTSALKQAAKNGIVHQADVRPLIRGRIYHKHIGQLYSRAKAEHVLTEIAREKSKDDIGRNTNKSDPVYRLEPA